MALGDLASLQVHMTNPGEFVECAWGLKALTNNPGWRQLLAEEWWIALRPRWLSGLVEDAQIRDVTVRDVVPGTAADVVYTGGGIQTGAIAGPSVPPQVAGLITWRTDLAGRAHRGRTFVPRMPRSWVEENGDRWTEAGQDYLFSYAELFYATYSRVIGSSDIAFLVVISRQLDGVPRAPVGTQVTSFDTSAVLATQRRRLHR